MEARVIEYSRQSRRRVHRVAIWTILVVGLLLLKCPYAELLKKFAILNSQFRLASIKLAPTDKMFEGDPRPAYSLVISDPRFHYAIRGAVRSIPEWEHYKKQLGLQNSESEGIIFVHNLQSPAGLGRIVAVEVEGGSNGGLCFMVSSISGETLTRHAVVKTQLIGCDWTPSLKLLNIAPYYSGNIQFFAGQPDLCDPSRFTVGLRLLGATGVLDGQLMDDGTVSLSLQNPMQLRGAIDQLRQASGMKPIVDATPWSADPPGWPPDSWLWVGSVP